MRFLLPVCAAVLLLAATGHGEQSRFTRPTYVERPAPQHRWTNELPRSGPTSKLKRIQVRQFRSDEMLCSVQTEHLGAFSLRRGFFLWRRVYSHCLWSTEIGKSPTDGKQTRHYRQFVIPTDGEHVVVTARPA